jgi:Bacterial regulatory proteins, luxR family
MAGAGDVRLGEAREAFQAALDREETPEALEGLGVATGWLGDARTSVAVRERAYLGYRRRGDDEAAARAAIGLAQDLLTFQGQPAVASGWLQRARRVLADRPGSPQLVAADVVESGLAREIAAELVLSVRTVERHLSNLYAKVGASGRTARAVATAYAHTHGLA